MRIVVMTSDSITSISDSIANSIRDFRRREGLSRDDLAKAARDAGAPADFTGNVIGYIETGRRDKDGRRRREVSVDELLALAGATGRPPVALIGAHGELFGADEVDCRRCADNRGQLEAVVRQDVAELAELEGVEGSLAEAAYALANRIDTLAGDDRRYLPALSKELRATLESIMAGRRGTELPDDDDDDLGDLDQPD